MDNNLTIVTGLWNIGRDGRPFTHYLQHFNHFLDIDANLFLYIPKELEEMVWAKRSKSNTFVKVGCFLFIKTRSGFFLSPLSWTTEESLKSSKN